MISSISTMLTTLRTRSTTLAARTSRRWMSAVPTKLTADERAAAFPKLTNAWALVDNRDAITRTFQFSDFNAAWTFMSRTALLAEQMGHHPEWFNVYNRVEVTLSTHDCSGLSKNDIDMALAMNKYAEALK